MPKEDCVMKCANCAHYRAEQGKCHRYPPVPVLAEDGSYWDFPDVLPEELCGEFARADN